MSIFEAILLGMIQGITEFFPISSSGHLLLCQKLMGFKNLENYLFFDLVCHCGTLLSVLFIFYRDILELLSDRRKFFQLLIGTLPLFPLVFILKPIKVFFNDPKYLGFFFLLTALLLYLGERFSSCAEKKDSEADFKDAFKIGLLQALAILPGVSRSGCTISGARILGWEIKHAITFSFLLSVPAILGGMCLEFYKLRAKSGEVLVEIDLSIYLAALATSFLIGYLALKVLFQLAFSGKFKIFVWYCLALGTATLAFFT